MEEEAAVLKARKSFALVTGANKGIGLEICRQLASKGVLVILTSRNEKRGIKAVERLKEFGLSDYVAFHRLDVADPETIAAAVEFVRTEYGRLDILVNNAGIGGIGVEGDVSIIQECIEGDVASIFANGEPKPLQLKADATMIQTYKTAEECIETNYYGTKRVTQALIPLLQLSKSPRIVNISSLLGHIKLVQNKWAQAVLTDEASLTEERIDEVVQEFLKDFKEGRSEENNWPTHVAAYKVSKAALIAYTKVLAQKHTDMCINCLSPGFVRTDITCNLGTLSASEAAENVVRVVMLPQEGPPGAFLYMKDLYAT